MEIVVLGTGCQKCSSLEKLTREVADELGVDATVRKEEDIVKIMSYGIRRTPALVINEKVVIWGRLPSRKEIVDFINQNNQP